jgi:hypothetical protein
MRRTSSLNPKMDFDVQLILHPSSTISHIPPTTATSTDVLKMSENLALFSIGAIAVIAIVAIVYGPRSAGQNGRAGDTQNEAMGIQNPP